MATMQDFIATYLNVDQAQRARRAQQVQEVTQRAQQISAVQQILSTTTDPAQQDQLIEFFGPMLGPNGSSTMRQIAAATSPTVQTTQAKIVADNAVALPEGAGQDIALSALGGTNRAGVAQSGLMEQLLSGTNVQPEWAEAFMQRFTTGMSPGDFAVSQGMAGSDKAQEIALGLALSAPQDVQAQQGWEGLRLTERGQTLQSELGWAGNRLGWAQLASQSALAELDMTTRMAAARQKAEAEGDQNAMKLLEQITAIEKLIQQGNMNRDAIARQMTVMKDYYRQLVGMGYEQFRGQAEMDITDATKNTFVPGMGYKFWGTRGPGNW